jgi:uncharacterized membrane protein YfcA
MMNALLLGLVALCASFIQSVTGFGFGIFAMIFLPGILLYTEANVLSTMLSLLTSISVVIFMHRKINWKNLIGPLVGCTITTYFAVSFIKSQKNETMLLFLGIVLFLLSLYFFFFSGKCRIRPTWYAGLTAGVISGVMGGMFSIGGPPVVIYFVQSEEDTDHYLATISAYFVLSGAVSVATKASAGFVTENVLVGFAAGFVGLLIGTVLGKLSRDKINSAVLKKLVYGFMAISGLVNVATSLI